MCNLSLWLPETLKLNMHRGTAAAVNTGSYSESRTVSGSYSAVVSRPAAPGMRIRNVPQR
jgi:hypothetical protein